MPECTVEELALLRMMADAHKSGVFSLSKGVSSTKIGNEAVRKLKWPEPSKTERAKTLLTGLCAKKVVTGDTKKWRVRPLKTLAMILDGGGKKAISPMSPEDFSDDDDGGDGSDDDETSDDDKLSETVRKLDLSKEPRGRTIVETPVAVSEAAVLAAIVKREMLSKKTSAKSIYHDFDSLSLDDVNASIRKVIEKLVAEGKIVEFTPPSASGKANVQYRFKSSPAAIESKPVAARIEVKPGSVPTTVVPVAKDDGVISQKTAYLTSKKLLDERKQRLIAKHPKEAECIEYGAVWLGWCGDTNEDDDWANWKKQISSGQMHKLIEERAKNWTDETHIHHPLKDFFEKNGTKGGYKVKAGWEFDVDHIWPKSSGGWDHPRNYAIMSSVLNGSFYDNVYDEKMALFDTQVVRQIHKQRLLMETRVREEIKVERINAMLAGLPRLSYF